MSRLMCNSVASPTHSAPITVRFLLYPHLQAFPKPLLDVMKELRCLRAEVATLHKRHAELRRELHIAKSPPIKPISPDCTVPANRYAPTSQTAGTPDPPLPKRIAVSAHDSQCVIARGANFRILEGSCGSQTEKAFMYITPL